MGHRTMSTPPKILSCYPFVVTYSVTQLCPTLCDSTDCSLPGSPVLHHLPFLPRESHGQRSLAGCSPWGGTESDTTEATYHTCMSTESVMPSNHLILCLTLLLLPSIFPSIRVFSSELALCSGVQSTGASVW